MAMLICITADTGDWVRILDDHIVGFFFLEDNFTDIPIYLHMIDIMEQDELH